MKTKIIYSKYSDEVPIIDGHKIYIQTDDFIDRLIDKELFQIDNVSFTLYNNHFLTVTINWSIPNDSYKTKKLKEFSFSRFKYCQENGIVYGSDFVAFLTNFGEIKTQKYNSHIEIGLYKDANNKVDYEPKYLDVFKYGMTAHFLKIGTMKPVENIKWILSKDEEKLIQKIQYNEIQGLYNKL